VVLIPPASLGPSTLISTVPVTIAYKERKYNMIPNSHTYVLYTAKEVYRAICTEGRLVFFTRKLSHYVGASKIYSFA
jgi:hypothetical protein